MDFSLLSWSRLVARIVSRTIRQKKTRGGVGGGQVNLGKIRSVTIALKKVGQPPFGLKIFFPPYIAIQRRVLEFGNGCSGAASVELGAEDHFSFDEVRLVIELAQDVRGAIFRRRLSISGQLLTNRY